MRISCALPILTLLLLVPLSFALQSCNTKADCSFLGNGYTCNDLQQCEWVGGWGELVQVRVLDAYNRLLPNATVNVTWQLSETRGYTTSINRFTNLAGRVNFSIDNTEIEKSATDYTYIVRVGFQNWTNRSTYTVNVGAVPRTLTLPVYNVVFQVKDKEGHPLSIPLAVDGKSIGRSDAGGVATMFFGQGLHNVSAQYGDLRKSLTFNVQDDMTVNVSLKLYNLAVRVMDDTGAPLIAQVYVGSTSKPTDNSGKVVFYNLTDPSPLLNAYYGRYAKTSLVNLDGQNETTLLFDTHPPEISDVQSGWKGSVLQIQAKILDLGDYSSGLREGNASISIYYITPDGNQHTMPMYTIGHNLYEGLIPISGGAEQIRYTVQAIDADGNAKSSSDIFVVPTAEPNNPPGSNKPPVNMSGNNLLSTYGLPVGAMLVIALLAGFLWWRYKHQKPPSEMVKSDNPNAVYQTRPDAPLQNTGTETMMPPMPEQPGADAPGSKPSAAPGGNPSSSPSGQPPRAPPPVPPTH